MFFDAAYEINQVNRISESEKPLYKKTSKMRNRRPGGPRQNDSTQSIFRLHRSSTKNIVLYICLLQAIVVMSVAMYILMYLPLMLVDEPRLDSDNDDTEAVGKAGSVSDGFSFKISEVSEQGYTSDGKMYAIFRFDKFRTRQEREITKQMKTSNGEFVYLSKAEKYLVEDQPGWVDFKTVYEPGKFEEYGGRVVRIKDVQINPSLGYGKAGGDELEEVLNQDEKEEYMKLQKGYFLYKAKEKFEYKLPTSADISKMAEGLLVDEIKTHKSPVEVNKRDKVAIFTIRHDFANFYHSTMNWYDIFLLMVIFKIDRNDVEIVWLDSHPRSKMDYVWESLYGKPVRAGNLTRPVTYSEIIWNGIGALSQINTHKLNDLPYVNEFRHYMLSQFFVSDVHRLNCDAVQVTIIWRRDHVSHPRNPSGFVSRKIENEEELWETVKASDKSLVVNGIQLDAIPMQQQLDLIAQTDILIGMHGAGLTHVLYLPKTSGVIELYPTYVSPANAHFRAFSKWRRIPYLSWKEVVRGELKSDHKTSLPVNIVKEMVIRMKNILCEKKEGP